jgi:hypothetical protein
VNARYLPLLVSFIHTGAAVAEGEPSDSLTISAAAPVVSVSQHPPGRYFLSLPTLKYTFEVGTVCSGEAKPQSLSINIADSRRTLSAPELDVNGTHKVLLAVPAQQLAPIAIDQFCVYDMTDAISIVEPEIAAAAPLAEPARITVGAALSAHVSLLCSDDSSKQITYVTRPLDVTLACDTVTLPGNAMDPAASSGR